MTSLTRTDKWYIGSGDGLVWAPPFPSWHDTPGFWDEAHLAQHRIGPLFTVSFADARGNASLPRASRSTWTPASLHLRYRLSTGLQAVELRSAPGDRILASEWSLRNRSRRRLVVHVIAWVAIDGEVIEDDGVEPLPEGIRVVRSVTDRKNRSARIRLEYRLTPGHLTWAAYRSEHSGNAPDFTLTPFFDRWPSEGGLRDERHLGGIDRRGLVYAGLHRRFVIGPGHSTGFRISVQVTPASLPVPRPETRSQGGSSARTALQGWNRFRAALPTFECGNPAFTAYWWYRWYGLRLNAVPAGLGQYTHRSVCEGIGYFHQPISYSAMCHARETRWANDPAWPRGVIHTFLDRLKDDGGMHGRVYLDHLRETDFYHADWGGAIADVDAVHPDPRWLADIYPAVARYAGWLQRTRDTDGSGMLDVTNQYETGQEYMSRYEAVDPDADRFGWENRIRLKGVDVTVYAYRLFRLLAAIAPEDAVRRQWRSSAERTRAALRERMWDPALGMFSDVNPASGERTRVKAAVCFYPYLTDVVDAGHLEGLARHLFNPEEFWTPFPVPSSSVDDPRFNPDAEWKGKRHVCPWNGRVWPMTNSHLIDALARVVRWHRPDWAPRLVHFLTRFVRMMSFDQDPARPNCFEHYHPFTGRGSRYRGIDDYQHSWVNDLLLRHVAGLLPRGVEGLMIDPLPFGIDLALRGVRVAGRKIDLTIRGGEYRLRIDGRGAGRGRVGNELVVPW